MVIKLEGARLSLVGVTEVAIRRVCVLLAIVVIVVIAAMLRLVLVLPVLIPLLVAALAAMIGFSSIRLVILPLLAALHLVVHGLLLVESLVRLEATLAHRLVILVGVEALRLGLPRLA